MYKCIAKICYWWLLWEYDHLVLYLCEQILNPKYLKRCKWIKTQVVHWFNKMMKNCEMEF